MVKKYSKPQFDNLPSTERMILMKSFQKFDTLFYAIQCNIYDNCILQHICAV